MPTRRPTILLLVTVALAGCGSDADYANRARPPAPINVGASVSERAVSVSPDSFAAGPVVFIIANQTSTPQKVTIETENVDSGPGIQQTTSPIQPAGTATLQVDMAEGEYELRTDGDGIKPAPVRVEGQRDSAQNELLQP